MSKKFTRKDVIDHLIYLREEEIKTLEETHKMQTESLDLDEDSSVEVDDLVQQSRSTDDAFATKIRLDEAKKELESFIILKPELVPGITEGNVVFTNKVNMVIGLAFQQFELDGVKFVGISTNAPIYKSLEGKIKGDTLEFNGVEYTIEEIL
ncbi:MAG: hypothetical protein KIG88_00855 [Weeksellaceae bacterium]|nr:hypothetical protein [Weeksellaceae bacterium]